MSLGTVLSTALSGLTAAQTSLNNISNNITNVNTPGYARKVVDQQAVVNDGSGAGVEITGIRRITDQFLENQLRISSADSARFDAISQLQDQLQALLGNPSNGTTFSSKLDTLFAGFDTLASTPASTPARISAIDDIQEFGDEISRLAGQIQSLRAEADGHVGDDVTTVNEGLQRIVTLNKQILQQRISGGETGALEDQLNTTIADISKVVDVRTFTLSNGGVGLATTSGVVLVDDFARKLVYSPQGTVSSSTQFDQITVNRLDPTTGAVAATGTPLDPAIASGSLRGWLDMRDQALPQIGEEISELSRQVADQLNAAHNANISMPPPASETGRQTGLAASDLQGFTGQATFYAFDANQQITSQFTMDFSALPPGSTINDVILAVNAGLGGDGTLTLSNGVLSFAAGGSATGIGIQDDTPPSSRGGRGFSQFFGLNDLVQTSINTIRDTGLTTADVHGFSGQTALRLVGPNNERAVSYTLDFSSPPLSNPGATLDDVLTELNASTGMGSFVTFSLDGNGALIATPKAGYEDYKVNVGSDSSDRGGTGVSFSSLFAIGSQARTNAAVDLQVADRIVADVSLLSLAQIDPTGSPAITAGDNRGAMALQALAKNVLGFADAGNISAVNTTLNGYAGQILANAGRNAAQAQASLDDRTALQTELKKRVDSVSGVNLDEELANMIVFQNAYNASARLITTAKEMMDTLINL